MNGSVSWRCSGDLTNCIVFIQTSTRQALIDVCAASTRRGTCLTFQSLLQNARENITRLEPLTQWLCSNWWCCIIMAKINHNRALALPWPLAVAMAFLRWFSIGNMHRLQVKLLTKLRRCMLTCFLILIMFARRGDFFVVMCICKHCTTLLSRLLLVWLTCLYCPFAIAHTYVGTNNLCVIRTFLWSYQYLYL